MHIPTRIALSFGLIVSAFSLSPQAQADGGFYIEPGIQYLSGSGNISSPFGVANSTTSDYGVGFDLKAGFHVAEVLFAGLDGSYSTPQYIDGGNQYSAASNLQELGVLVGAQMPIVGLRIWGDYILSSTLDPAAAPNGLDLRFKNGTGFKLGAGFHILLVSLNLEYEDVNYGTTDIQSAGSNSYSSTNSITLHDKRWIASVSIPITL